MNIPSDLRYSDQHEWVRVNGTTATIGITDFAQDSLGDIVFVGLPDVGAMAEAGGSLCEVESTKSVSDIYAPISGRVTEVNHALDDTPELVNQDPYGDGWMFTIEMSDPTEVDRMLDAAGYEKLTQGT